MNTKAIAFLPKIRSKAITQSARGTPCALRITSFYPGLRCADGTVVWCHLTNFGKGMSTKVSDQLGAYGCAHCHSIVDGAAMDKLSFIREHYESALWEQVFRAIGESQARLIDDGIMTGPDWRIIK